MCCTRLYPSDLLTTKGIEQTGCCRCLCTKGSGVGVEKGCNNIQGFFICSSGRGEVIATLSLYCVKQLLCLLDRNPHPKSSILTQVIHQLRKCSQVLLKRKHFKSIA